MCYVRTASNPANSRDQTAHTTGERSCKITTLHCHQIIVTVNSVNDINANVTNYNCNSREDWAGTSYIFRNKDTAFSEVQKSAMTSFFFSLLSAAHLHCNGKYCVHCYI